MAEQRAHPAIGIRRVVHPDAVDQHHHVLGGQPAELGVGESAWSAGLGDIEADNMAQGLGHCLEAPALDFRGGYDSRGGADTAQGGFMLGCTDNNGAEVLGLLGKENQR